MGDDLYRLIPDLYYKIISANQVDAEKVERAKKVLEFCKKTLKRLFNMDLPEFELAWITTATEKDYKEDEFYRKLDESINKFFSKAYSIKNPLAVEAKVFRDPDPRPFQGVFQVRKRSDGNKSVKILLCADIPAYKIPETMAHELFHLISWDLKGRRRYAAEETIEGERMADEFEKNLLKEMWKWSII